ncbi:hypothetical protein CcaverHIS002_0507950 [Cutaneotrichosporon cavernicola]|nr:hypothetical protein CcaverHIS002_0507950 [Cutaneotrichosporon cavernicola]
MVKYGSYTLDAPPPFQGTWRAIVDRLYYHFHFVRLQLACGDCGEIVLRPDGESYLFMRCRRHRGFYDGFCPFVGQRYIFDDGGMHMRRVNNQIKGKGEGEEQEEKKRSLSVPFCLSPEPMAEPPITNTTRDVAGTDAYQITNHLDSARSFSGPLHQETRGTAALIDPFPFQPAPNMSIPVTMPPDLPSQTQSGLHDSEDKSNTSVPGTRQPPALHANPPATSTREAAGAFNTLATHLARVDTDTQAAIAQAHTISLMQRELETMRVAMGRLRAERSRLLAFRESIFDMFGLDDPEEWTV